MREYHDVANTSWEEVTNNLQEPTSQLQSIDESFLMLLQFILACSQLGAQNDFLSINRHLVYSQIIER